MTFPALRPAELHVLLALAEEPQHGYGLAHRIGEESEGRVSLLPGNLYAVLARLQERGWVGEADADAIPPGADGRRRYFELTANGRRCLSAETRRLERLIAATRGRQLADEGDGGARP